MAPAYSSRKRTTHLRVSSLPTHFFLIVVKCTKHKICHPNHLLAYIQWRYVPSHCCAPVTTSHHPSIHSTSHLPELNLCAHGTLTSPPPATGNHPSAFGIREFDYSGDPRSRTIQYFSYRNWLISLTIVSSGFTHLVAWVRMSFLFRPDNILLCV